MFGRSRITLDKALFSKVKRQAEISKYVERDSPLSLARKIDRETRRQRPGNAAAAG